jgi:hypothetical protein
MRRTFKIKPYGVMTTLTIINAWLTNWSYGKIGKRGYKIIVQIERGKR